MKKKKMFSLDGKREIKIYQVIPDQNLPGAFMGFSRRVGCDGLDVFLPIDWFSGDWCGLSEAEILKHAHEENQPLLKGEEGDILIPFDWLDEKFNFPQPLRNFKKWIIGMHNLPMIHSQ